MNPQSLFLAHRSPIQVSAYWIAWMSELVKAARKYLGYPFRHRARGPRYFDCAGLLL